MKEALLYEKLDGGGVRCNVCSHRCRIRPGKRGICGVRENRDGTLYALNYGRAVSVAVDPVEKKPLYHFLPGTLTYSFATVGCNFRCAWCQNWTISQASKDGGEIEGDEIPPEEHVRLALATGCPSISYTYSEPTIFLEYALDTMKLAQAKGLKNIWVTNGFMTPETLDLIGPFLDAANVDFKGWGDAVYERYCGGRAEPIMETIRTLARKGIHQEITTLIVPGVNDQPAQLEQIARFLVETAGPDIPWHLSRFFPAWKMPDTPPTTLEILREGEAIGRRAGLKHIHLGNI